MASTPCRPSSTATCRSLPAHPHSPRPVNLNVWEAVDSDHDLGELTSLARLAAGIGVERYVLDDGWFAGRRSDPAGLGDWWVDEEVWPGGLHRLVDFVRTRACSSGCGSTPRWSAPTPTCTPRPPRLDPRHRTAHPAAAAPPLRPGPDPSQVAGYPLERISQLLSEYEISCVKWDCNRDITDAGSGTRSGAPAAHDQARAVYALLDELRRRHPDVEWESCASGGGWIDLAMPERVQRVGPPT